MKDFLKKKKDPFVFFVFPVLFFAAFVLFCAKKTLTTTTKNVTTNTKKGKKNTNWVLPLPGHKSPHSFLVEFFFHFPMTALSSKIQVGITPKLR